TPNCSRNSAARVQASNFATMTRRVNQSTASGWHWNTTSNPRNAVRVSGREIGGTPLQRAGLRAGQRRMAPDSVRAFDAELAEGDAEVPAAADAAERERDFALGDDLAAGGFDGAGVGLGAGIAADDLADV